MILAEERTTEEERMHIMEGLYEVFFPPCFICCWTSKLIYLSPPFTNTRKQKRLWKFSHFPMNWFFQFCGDFFHRRFLSEKFVRMCWDWGVRNGRFVRFQDVVNTQSTFYISCWGVRGRRPPCKMNIHVWIISIQLVLGFSMTSDVTSTLRHPQPFINAFIIFVF